MKRLLKVFVSSETDTILSEARDYINANPNPFYEIMVTPKKVTRSKDQNNLYWALVDTITQWMNDKYDFGWKTDDTHKFLKYEFFSDRDTISEAIHSLQDWAITTTQFLTIIEWIVEDTTTTNKDTLEFTEIIEHIIKHFRNLGLELNNNLPPIQTYEELHD